MEKFVTDLDKILDDFECSNGKAHGEPYDSSGYNSMKVSSELNVINSDFDRQLLTFPHHECTSIDEQSSPTTNEFSEISVNEINTIENSDKAEDLDISITSNIDISDRKEFNSKVYVESSNNTQHDKRRTNPNDSNSSVVSLSPSPTQVPPRKKSRPNSLLGLSSNIHTESHSAKISTVISSENVLTDNNEKISCINNNFSSITRRPKSLNIVGQDDKSNNTVPKIVFNVESPVIYDNVLINATVTDKIEDAVIPIEEMNIWQGIPVEELGQKEPTWIGDDMSEKCMQCDMVFTVFRRRHHCRACGRLLCNKCCCWRMQLHFSSKLFPKDRVCAVCFQYLIRVEAARKQGQSIKSSNLQPLNSMLKSNRPMSIPITPNSLSFSQQSIVDNVDNTTSFKSVMFADGIRPGGDLTENETSRVITPTQFRNRSQIKSLELNSQEHISREPELFEYKENFEIVGLEKKTVSDDESNHIMIPITKNLYIQLQILELPYCTCSVKDVSSQLNQQECDCESVECWYFASVGFETIGIEEIIVILRRLSGEVKPPIEVVRYYFQVYQRASKNETKYDNMEMTVEIFSENYNNLKEWAGILHIRPTFQSFNKIPTPCSSFLIGILIHRWEFPWATLLPLRLILALGYQSRFYPCSVISDRNRPSVYGEVGQTILQLVNSIFAFPNNFERSLFDTTVVPTVPGMWLHLLVSQEIIVQIPKHSYSKLLDILSSRQSEYNPIALAASFSREADSHLVCCQNEASDQYYSSAISIQNTERSITAATIILFAPCKDNDEDGTTIVEDAIVVKLSHLHLGCIINSLKTMSDFALQCGTSIDSLGTKKSGSSPVFRRSIIKIVWTDSFQMSDMASIDRSSYVTVGTVQSALKSLRNGGDKAMRSYRVPSSLQNMYSYKENQNTSKLKLVWTRFHMVESGSGVTDLSYEDPVDLEKIIRETACVFGNLLIPFLDMIHAVELTNIGLRIKIGPNNVDWGIGCSKRYQYCFSPDQSPTCESDSRNNTYIVSKMRNDQRNNFYNIEKLPGKCLDYVNKDLESFLHSKRLLLQNECMISELEFHIID